MLSRPVISDSLQPMDCSRPGSSVHGDSPGKTTGVGYHALLQGIFRTPGSNPGLQLYRQILYNLSHQGSPLIQTTMYKINYKDTFWSSLVTQW